MDTTDLASAVNMTGEQVSHFTAESPVMSTAGMNPPAPPYNFETISKRVRRRPLEVGLIMDCS